MARSSSVLVIQKWCSALLVMGVVMLLAVSAADAQSNPLKRRPKDPQAQRHLDQGNRFFRILDYEKAIAEYKAGAAIEGHEIFYFNLAQAYRQTERYEEAIRLYEQWLARANPTGQVRNGVVELIEQMRAELAKKASTEPPTGPAADLPVPSRPSEPTPPDVDARRQSPSAASAVEPWYADRWAWAGVGAGVLATGIGGGLLVSAGGLRDDADQAASQQERHDLADRADGRALWGSVVGGVGLAVLTAGAVKLVLSDQGEQPPAVSLVVGRGVIGFMGSF